MGAFIAREFEDSLNKSAWRHIYNFLDIKRIATAKDKKLFEQGMAAPPDFSFDNIVATFGDYIQSPKDSILRGLAEVFSDLDPAFKSHDRMKIGVQGLPKRVIITGLDSFWGYGADKIRDILNAIALYQNKPLLSHAELQAVLKDEDALLKASELKTYCAQEGREVLKAYPARGVRLRRFKNGNGHLFLKPAPLKT